MFRMSALAGIVLIGLSAGAARAQQVVPIGLYNPGAGCAQPGCGLPPDACIVAVPCNDKHECCVKKFLDSIFGLKSTKKVSHTKSCGTTCGPTCAPQCPPGCVPAHSRHVCTPACQPAPQACAAPCPAPQACAAPCPPPAPKYTAVPVKLMMICRVPQPAPQVCQPKCEVPACQPAPQACQQACAPQCPPGCVPATNTCAHCGKLIQFHGFFHRHPQGQPCTTACSTPSCSTCGEAVPAIAPAAQQPGQPATLPPTASIPTAAYPQGQLQSYQPNGYVQGYTLGQQQQAPQPMPQAAPGHYGQLIQSIQAAQERDNKALRDMLETRQATQAVVRALQASDANTVDMFEKMIQQMKGAPSTPTIPVAPTGPTSAAPSVVAPIPGTSQAPAAGKTTLAIDEMKSILRDLQAPAVRTASATGN